MFMYLNMSVVLFITYILTQCVNYCHKMAKYFPNIVKSLLWLNGMFSFNTIKLDNASHLKPTTHYHDSQTFPLPFYHRANQYSPNP
jgi:hypothetical protein